MAERFDKFTERARKVLQLSQEEAQRFNHNYIGTEHLLLGLVREGEGVAAKVLASLGVDLNKVRSAVEFIIGRGERTVTGDIGLTPRAKKVIELAVEEARRLNHNYIGTEHLLLGMLREGEGIGMGVLESLGVSLASARQSVNEVLGAGASDDRPGLAGAAGRGINLTESAATAFSMAELSDILARFRDTDASVGYELCSEGPGYEYGVTRFPMRGDGSGWQMVHWDRDVVYQFIRGSGRVIVGENDHAVDDGTIIQVPARTSHEIRPVDNALYALQIAISL
jgi:mannose-6-phosphate isomerase-like protein (cupin superfamily)